MNKWEVFVPHQNVYVLKYDSIKLFHCSAIQIQHTHLFQSRECLFLLPRWKRPFFFFFFFFFPPPSNNPVKEVTIEMTLSPKECYNAWQYDSWDFGKISSTCFMLFMSIVDFLLSLLQLLHCTGMSLIIIIKFVICWREEKRRKCLFFFLL